MKILLPPLARCSRCLRTFYSRTIPPGAQHEPNSVFAGNIEPCPSCGGPANIEAFKDGQPRGFDLLAGLGGALGAADLFELQRFQAVLESAAEGAIERREAERRAAEINTTFARYIGFALQWGIPSLLIALIALYIQVKSAQSDNVDHDELMKELRRQSEQNEQLLEEWRRLEQPVPPPPSNAPLQQRTLRRALCPQGPKRKARPRPPRPTDA